MDTTRQIAKTGFTLVELLVVIAIIALLLAMLMPALQQVRRQGQKIASASNLREIGMAVNVYSSVNRDAMPPLVERHWGQATVPGLAGNGQGRSWAGVIKDSARVPMEVFRCPGDTRKYKLDANSFLVPQPGDVSANFDYGAVFVGYAAPSRRIPWTLLSTSGARNYGELRQSGLRKPAVLSLVWDAHADVLSDGTGYDHLKYVFNSDMKIQKWKAFWNQTVFRHRRKVSDTSLQGPNVMFADGHVEAGVDISRFNDDNVSTKIGR